MITSNTLWEAANRSGFRGLFYIPTLDAGAQLPEWTRTAISQKVNWLYNNVGYIRAVVDGLSLDEVDTGIWPKAATLSAEFNKASTDRFHDSWKDARFFDSRKVENVYSAQFLIRRQIRMHGELFGQLLRPDAANPFARVHFIPAWMIGNLGDEKPEEGWIDGIQYDELGAAVMYRIVLDRAKKQKRDVPADDMLHFHDEFFACQKRGTSCLAAVARKLFTLNDIERFVANGIQLRSMVAYAIERKEGDIGGNMLLPNVTDTETVTNDDGSQTLVQKITSQDGQEATIMEPPAGRTVKVIESNQAQEPFAFKNDVLRDVAHCTKYPPEYVFSLAGLTQGTLVRLTMRRVQIVKSTVRQFQLIPQFLEHAWRFRTWQDIKRGLFDGITIPTDWWRVKFICPADTTVDIAREGRLLDERVATGKMSIETYFGMNGEDRADVDEENLRIREERETLLDAANKRRAASGKPPLEYFDLWPANTQAAANAAAQPAPDPTPTDVAA